MPKIFLSHSSKDKPAVRRLARDLRNKGVHVWLDESETHVGDSLSAKLQQGLQESEFLGLWVTQNALSSPWVTREWQSKLVDEVCSTRVVVLPLLAEEVSLPAFLKDKIFADFREDYEKGLAQLLDAIQAQSPDSERTVSEYVQDLLDDLATAVISFPLHAQIEIIDSLKRLPRTGKLIRLSTFHPTIPVRSVYDHILSLAHTTDCLFPVINHGINPQEANELARCIVYHDLAEVLLGDVPAYTNITYSKRSRAHIVAESQFRKLPKGEPKRIASEFLGMFLDHRERECLKAAMRTLADLRHPVARFFQIVDKLDPIIAIWRYIHQFRGTLGSEAIEFLSRMKDFFDNPNVRDLPQGYREDPIIAELALLLQDRRLARFYYVRPDALPLHPPKLNYELMSRLIEGRPLLFVPEKLPRAR